MLRRPGLITPKMYRHRRHGGVDDDLEVSEEEDFVIPADHASESYDITEINGVLVGNFSMMQVTGINLTATFGSGGHKMLVQLSNDGGATFEAGSSDYRDVRCNASQTVLDVNQAGMEFTHMLASEQEWLNWVLIINNINVAMPVTIHGGTVEDVITTPHFRWGIADALPEVNDAIRIKLGGSGVDLTGGTLSAIGYR